MDKHESSVENFAGSCLKYPARTQCHFIYNGDEKLGQRMVELMAGVFSILLKVLSVSHKIISSTRSNRS